MVVKIRDACIVCIEAKAPLEQMVGLSQTESLDPGQGMLFIYPKEQPHTFWMPDSMKFDVDILFIDEDGVVGQVETLPVGARCGGRGKWVLEVPAGFCADAGIEEGDELTFEEDDPEQHEAYMSNDILRTLSTASMRVAQDAYDVVRNRAGWMRSPDPGSYGFAMDEAWSKVTPGAGEVVVAHFGSQWIAFGVDTDNVVDFVGAYLTRAQAEDAIKQVFPKMADMSDAIGDQGGGSTEMQPYQVSSPRERSVAPNRPLERFTDHELFDLQIPEGGEAVTNGPIHDEEWSSPTRGSV